MRVRKLAFVVLSGGLALAAVAEEPASETWAPTSRSAQAITGSVTLVPGQITFQNGAALQVSKPSQMLYRPEKKAKKVMADLYRVTTSPPQAGGPKLCGEKPVVYLIVWKAEKQGTMVAFSGPKFDPASPDECGRYVYDAGHH